MYFDPCLPCTAWINNPNRLTYLEFLQFYVDKRLNDISADLTIDYSVLETRISRPMVKRPLPPRPRIVISGVPARDEAINIVIETLKALEPDNSSEK